MKLGSLSNARTKSANPQCHVCFMCTICSIACRPGWLFLGVVVIFISQGRLREGKDTYAFFLDVQKAYDNGLWFKYWEFGVRGKMWRVMKRM